MSNRSTDWSAVAVVGLCLTPGCYEGGVFVGQGAPPGDAADGGTTEGDSGQASEDSGGSDGEPGDDDTSPLSPAPRVVRLTHEQYAASVRVLVDLPEIEELAAAFRPDTNEGGFFFQNNAESLDVDDALWNDYRVAAAAIAERVAEDPAVVATLLQRLDIDALDDGVVAPILLRLFRRPPTPSQLDAYAAVFADGSTHFPESSAGLAGLRLVLETALQSPHFLYRIERAQEIQGDDIVLDGYELAARLSYFMVGGGPDDALLAAAADDALADPDEFRAQAERLTQQPGARAVVARFHDLLLESERLDTIAGSLGESARVESAMFLEDLIFERDGGWRDVFTSTTTFANDELAAIYGVEPAGPGFGEVQLPPDRRGYFTHVGFLASYAHGVDPDPILRGAFLLQRIACESVGAPPNDVPPLPEIEPGQSNREAVVAHTEGEGTTCQACHQTRINPFGFALENYGPEGRFRTHEGPDGDIEIDSVASPLIDGVPTEVSGGVAMMDVLSQSARVHRCYAEHWLEMALGRSISPAEAEPVLALAEASQQGAGVVELMVELTQTRVFGYRSTEELP
ncbi:MAG: DUF1592 domain-containing protein [Myxococcota bacterium]